MSQMHQDPNDNPLHDVPSQIAMEELENIDLEDFENASEYLVANHIREIAERASIGQLRHVLGIKLDAEDMTREKLVNIFVEKRLATFLKIRQMMASIAQL
jgi:hypothetical protein